MFKYIKAMSYDRQKIQQDLRNVAKPLTDHLIKLYLFPNSQYENHWRKEIWGFLNRVPKARNNNKFPSARFIFDEISGYCDMSEQLMYLMIDEYSPSLIPERLDSIELQSILEDYLRWIADSLSQFGVVRSSEVYAKLDESGL